MSNIRLNDEIEVEPTQIASVTLEGKGAKINSKVVSVSSGDWQDLRVPEDSLVVRLKDGGEFVIRGEQPAKQGWDRLQELKDKQHLDFEMSTAK